MAYFNKAYPKMFIGSGAILESGHPKDLKAGTIGLVDFKTHALIDTAHATKADHPLAYLAIGSYAKFDNLGGINGGRKESDKTKGINPSYVSKWWKSAPSAGQTHKIQIGYDGSNACTCPEIFEKEKTYNLLVEVKGTPVLKALHRNLYKTYSVFTGCTAPCTDVCTVSADPKGVFDSWADQINTDPMFSKFIKASVGKQSNALPGDAVAYNVYTNTQTDDGSVQALAAIQTAYSTLNIVRLSYSGITSVYQVYKTGSAPASYNSIAWADANYDVYRLTRKLCMTLPMAVATADTTVTNALASRTDIVANSVVPYVDGDSNTNAGVYSSTVSVTQLSNNYVRLINDAITDVPTFDALQSINGEAFALCPCEADASGTGCFFLVLESVYSDTSFSNSSFDPTDLYDPTPLTISAQLVDENAGICNVKGLAITDLQLPKIPTGTGEELIREYIIYRAYKHDIFDVNPRMREVFDDTILNVIDPKKKYIKYFLLHSVPRFDNPSGMFNNDQYLVTIAFPEGTNTAAFEGLLGTYATSGSNGVALETK